MLAPVSPMHRALACPDIILDLIGQVSPPNWSSPPGPTTNVQRTHRRLLAALALACRAFNGPATKALWSRLDSFLPLMHLFSAFDGHETVAGIEPTYMFSGDILPHEFSRFCELGSFLKVVAPSSTTCVCESDTADFAVWHYLARKSGGLPLFPSLRELHWAISEPSSTEILFLLTSSLRRLTVCYGNWSQDMRDWKISQSMLFRTIFDVAPRLTHLTLSHVHTALLPACLSSVNILHGLRAVSLYEEALVDIETLRNLSSMESLEEISIAVDIPWLGGVVDFSGFSTLKKLEMIVFWRAHDPAHSFFDTFSSPGLRKLNLNLPSGITISSELSELCTLFAQRFPLLEDLTMALLTDTNITLDTGLAPLFPLRLVNFSLALTTPQATVYALTDGLFGALANAWPQLSALSIAAPDECVDPHRPDSGVTPQTLLALARGCPRLQTLRLPRMEGLRVEDLGGYPVLRHGLRTLVVDRPGIGEERDYAACALLLDRLFPALDLDPDAVCVDVGGGDLDASWRRVLDGVELCRLGRTNLVS